MYYLPNDKLSIHSNVRVFIRGLLRVTNSKSKIIVHTKVDSGLPIEEELKIK